MSYQPPFTLSDEIIDLLARISYTLGKLDYLQHSPQVFQLRKISQIKTITGTLQIEGNTLDEQQITAVLEGKTVLAPMREISIETFCIERLEKQGYEYIYAPDIAPDSDNPQRSSFEDVLLASRLTNAVARINPTIPHDAQQEAIKEISRIHSPELLSNNESFHRAA